MRSLLGRFHRPNARSQSEQLFMLNSLGDGSTLSLDFTTGVLDPRLTFTRSTNATFINSQGYVQYADANQQIYSQDQSQSGTWVRQDLNGVDANVTATIDPLGGNTASKLRSAATLQAHLIYSTITASVASGLAYTFSVYVKKAELKYVALHLASTARYTVIFDLDTGAMTTTNSNGTPLGTEYSSSDAGNGWWRLSATMITQTTTIYPHVCLSNSGTPSVNGSGQPYYTGTLNDGVYTWGAQLNAGSTPLRYIATTTAQKFDQPRFDYDPTTLAPQGLLIEGSATNLCQQGQFCWGNGSTFSWVRSAQIHINSVNGTSGANAVARIDGPDNGTLTGTSIFKDSGSTFVRSNIDATVIASTQYTYSMWVRAGTGGTTNFRLAPFNVGSALITVGACSDPNVGIDNASGFGTRFSNLPTDRWVRVWVVFTTAVAQTTATLTIYPNLDTSAASTNYIWGAQLELGNGASSTIPTGASTGSRAEDSATMSSVDSLGFDLYQGTFLVRGTQFKQSVSGTFARTMRLAGTTEPFGLAVDGLTLFGTSRNAANASIAEATRTNVLLENFAFGFALNANNATNTMVVSRNGSSISANRNATGPTGTVTALSFNSNSAATAYASMALRSVKFWPVAKTAEELNALTTGA